MKELEKVIKELREKNINILDLDIANEIMYQINENKKIFNDEEKQKIFNYSHRAYLKSENITIENIVKTIIDNFDELENIKLWDLIEKACWL